MKLRGSFLFLAVFSVTLAQYVSAQPTNHWRSFKKADGLPENACVSITLGASGDVLVRHAKSSAISVLDGYDLTTVPGPGGTNRNRIYESPGGQLWTVAPEGLQEFRDGEWTLHRVAEVADHFRTGRTNEITLLPFRQGRVFILLPDRLLQLDAEDPDQPRVELFARAEETTLGGFATLSPARDGGAWISGANGFAKLPAPLRSLKPADGWLLTNSPPEELSRQALDGISNDDLGVRRIFDRAVDAGGVFWLATSDGLFRHAPEIWAAEPDRAKTPRDNQRLDAGSEKSSIRNSKPRVDPDLLGSAAAATGITDWKTSFTTKSGDAWLGGGIHVAWRHQNKWHVFASTNQLGPEQVVAFAETLDGHVWCATPDKVWEFNGRDWLAARGGFARVTDLLGARDGTLWVATTRGLYRLAQGTWIENTREDGLVSDVILRVAEDDVGIIRAETDAGWSRFQPDADRAPPKTYLQTATFDSPLSFREGSVVTLAFQGRDQWKQTPPNRLLFSYRLDEREWSPFQPEREIPLIELALGKHYFQVRAMDRNGNIDPKPARLEFTVIVPWYRETRLVLILSVALGIAVFFAALAANRHRKLRLSYAEVERKIAERTRELERANRELLHSQKMNALGSLAAGIAHDFNNILSIVKGSAQIIEDNAGNPEKIRIRVDRIKTVVQQGAEVVEAMLGFSRSTDQPPAPCDLNVVVDETRKLLGDRFLRETEVRFDRGEKLPEISVPRDFVQQILLNFIFNAAEAMERRPPARLDGDSNPLKLAGPESGALSTPTRVRKQITLTTRAASAPPSELFLAPATAPSFILIAVRDAGSGIAPEIKPRIFEPFFTTKALSTKRGTGLGLSMVYELAKKMEAGLAVESVVGQGSTFTLILPVREPKTVNQVKP